MILDMEGHFVSDTVAPVRQPKVLGRFLMVDFLISSSILDKTKTFPQTPKFNMCIVLLERNIIYIYIYFQLQKSPFPKGFYFHLDHVKHVVPLPGDAVAVVQDHNFDRKHPSHSSVRRTIAKIRWSKCSIWMQMVFWMCFLKKCITFTEID